MNREVLAVNQDPLGVPGKRVKRSGACEPWNKPLADGSLAVALINRGFTGADFLLKAADLGLPESPKLVPDLWAQADIADFGAGLARRVEPHETLLWKIIS